VGRPACAAQQAWGLPSWFQVAWLQLDVHQWVTVGGCAGSAQSPITRQGVLVDTPGHTDKVLVAHLCLQSCCRQLVSALCWCRQAEHVRGHGGGKLVRQYAACNDKRVRCLQPVSWHW
jgi:hypothetical protein